MKIMDQHVNKHHVDMETIDVKDKDVGQNNAQHVTPALLF